MIHFDGFLAAYTDQKEDDDEDEERPAACRRSAPATRSPSAASSPTQHFTEPPPRYSEATLIKKMEELGIGRPSTYASTLSTLRTATMSGSTSGG